jgi:Gamma-glutamyl cyclotransferase, AIG2-like
MQRKFRSAKGKDISWTDNPYALRPMWYFFYGTLMDPSRLASIAGLEEIPDVVYAKVHLMKVRYWGQFPALVPGKIDTVVEGVAWFAPSVEVINRLRAYETNAYLDEFFEIEFKNGEKVMGRAFEWAGDEEDLADSPESYVEDLSDSD